jgi:hypothetical protein
VSGIKVGDLVMVISSGINPLGLEHVGKVGIVIGAPKTFDTIHFSLSPPTICSNGREMIWPPHRLKKIDPPATDEFITEREELTHEA